MLYFWKAEGSRMSNMTFLCVNTIQLGPQCKNCFLRHHFRRKSGSQRATSSFLMWQQIFFFPNALRSQRHVLGQRAILSHTCSTLFVTFPNERARKWVKEWREDNFRKEWMKALKKTRILVPADIRGSKSKIIEKVAPGTLCNDQDKHLSSCTELTTKR